MQCLHNHSVVAISSSFPSTPSSSTSNSSSLRRPSCRAPRLRRSPEAYADEGGGTKNTIYLPSNVQIITSTSNPFVKHCVKLRQSSSYRYFHGSVLLVGTTPIREICIFHEALLDTPTFECLFVLEHSHIPEEITQSTARVIHVSREVINKISGVLSADSVDIIALARIPSTFHVLNNSAHEEDFSALFTLPHRILVLDGIQDPGNLGTLIRSAKAFQWDGVFLLPGCCDPFNDKALRACRGACFQMPIVCGHWKHIETLRQEFQMKMIAGHPGSTSNGLIPVTTLSKDFADSVAEVRVCLVLGSEGGGLSEYSRKACELVSIPMAGEFESLNVSVAGGIFMYMLQII